MFGARGDEECPICFEADCIINKDSLRSLNLLKVKEELTALYPCGHSYCGRCVAQLEVPFDFMLMHSFYNYISS